MRYIDCFSSLYSKSYQIFQKNLKILAKVQKDKSFLEIDKLCHNIYKGIYAYNMERFEE